MLFLYDITHWLAGQYGSQGPLKLTLGNIIVRILIDHSFNNLSSLGDSGHVVTLATRNDDIERENRVSDIKHIENIQDLNGSHNLGTTCLLQQTLLMTEFEPSANRY